MLRSDPRLPGVRWRDLVELSSAERAWELLLPLPWLALSLISYSNGWIAPGMSASFFFFLTGLRLSHNCQHCCLGIGRRGHDAVMFILSCLMLASMHAVQVTHLHHHRHCLHDDDIEAGHVGLPWWRVLFGGPKFVIQLHREAWRMAPRSKRVWIGAELIAAGLFALGIVAVAVIRGRAVPNGLCWHIGAMAVGECMTAFFAVWIVHRGCDAEHSIARTQRGWLKNVVSYSMFYHLEHHLFPAVPTCHLDRLAERLDEAAPEAKEKQVV